MATVCPLSLLLLLDEVTVGALVGAADGSNVGAAVGAAVGSNVGAAVGASVGDVGEWVHSSDVPAVCLFVCRHNKQRNQNYNKNVRN
jgi:outer membrane lipoprotein SlyB